MTVARSLRVYSCVTEALAADVTQGLPWKQPTSRARPGRDACGGDEGREEEKRGGLGCAENQAEEQARSLQMWEAEG